MAEPECTTIVETWKPIIGYEGYYSVSDRGRVRRDKGGSGAHVGTILKRLAGTDGYWYASLSRRSKMWRVAIHILVMRTFVGPCPPGHNVNHKDGDKKHCDLRNLEYVTFSANSAHAVKRGLTKVGEDHGQSKLTNQQVKQIKHLLRTHTSQTIIAKRFRVNDTVISKIKRGEIWRHIE